MNKWYGNENPNFTHKVRVTLSIEVDRDAWEATFGEDFDSVAEFRQDVKDYYAAQNQCLPEHLVGVVRITAR